MPDDIRDAGAPGLVIVAQSMGAQVTRDVLRQMALSGNRATLSRVRSVVLLSPDIDPGVFGSQAEAIGRLPRPFVIFTARNDPALRLSARLTGHPNRLCNISGIADVAGLDVTVIDLTSAKDAVSDHLAALTSPSVIAFLMRSEALRQALEGDPSGCIGLLPGTVLLAQEATAVILAPAVAIDEALR